MADPPALIATVPRQTSSPERVFLAPADERLLDALAGGEQQVIRAPRCQMAGTPAHLPRARLEPALRCRSRSNLVASPVPRLLGYRGQCERM